MIRDHVNEKRDLHLYGKKRIDMKRDLGRQPIDMKRTHIYI